MNKSAESIFYYPRTRKNIERVSASSEKGPIKNCVFERLTELFDTAEVSDSSAGRVFTETFFTVIKKGSEQQISYFVSHKNINILAKYRGKNVLQAFCDSVGLASDRYLQGDFNPEKEIPKNRLGVYYVLNTHYKDALRQKEELKARIDCKIGEMDILKKQALIEPTYPILEVLCKMPENSLKELKNLFNQKSYFPRKVVLARRMIRKIIGHANTKNRV